MVTRASPFSFYNVVIFLILLTSSSSQAYEFHVGGKRGWGLKPSKRYKDWACKTRFQVGDSLGNFHHSRSSLILGIIKEKWVFK